MHGITAGKGSSMFAICRATIAAVAKGLLIEIVYRECIYGRTMSINESKSYH